MVVPKTNGSPRGVLADHTVRARRGRNCTENTVRLTANFEIGVGLHQGSALRLFVIVRDVISETCRTGLSMKSMYADDLILIAEFVNELKERCRNGSDL